MEAGLLPEVGEHVRELLFPVLRNILIQQKGGGNGKIKFKIPTI